MENLTGKVFNDLTAIKYVGTNNGQGSNWLWKCICGNEKVYSAHNVKSGHTLSCGCRRSRDCDKPKDCRHCGEPSDRLNRHGSMASVCQKCYNKQTNGFKERNPKIRMVQSAKQRARIKNIPFDLSPDDFELPEYCPILGIKLEYGNRTMHENSPSLDKIIPKLGYIKGNVAVISHRANWIKSNASVEELEKVLHRLRAHVANGTSASFSRSV